MVSWRVTLCNRNLSFDIREGETILEAAERAGVVLLAGCRAGACRTCALRSHRGRVHLPDATSLNPEMLAAHVVLACVATVSSDCEFDAGTPEQPLLHPRWIRPWTE